MKQSTTYFFLNLWTKAIQNTRIGAFYLNQLQRDLRYYPLL